MPLLYAFVTYLISLHFNSCTDLAKKTEPPERYQVITKASIILDVPSLDIATKQLRHYPDSSIIYSCDDHFILKRQRQHRLFLLSDKEDVSEMQLVSEKTKWYYFVYNEKEPTGLYYDTLSAAPIVLPVDSFLKKNLLRISLDAHIEKYWKMVSSQANEKVYTSRAVNKSGLKDSLKLSFSDSLSNMPFVLSKPINQRFGSFLYKVEMILSPYFDARAHLNVPKMRVFVEVEKNTVLDEEELQIRQLIRKRDE